MPDRYKKINFKDFRGGEGNQLTDVENGYQEGTGVRVSDESGKLELAPGASIVAISAVDDLLENYAFNTSDEYTWVVVTNSSLDHLIYRSSDGNTWTLFQTITQVSWPVENVWVVVNGNRVLLDSGDTTDAYLSVNGGAFSVITRTTNISAENAQKYAGYLDGYVYVPGFGDTLDFAIYRSIDLQTWEKVLEYDDSSLEAGAMFGFQGFMHIKDSFRIFRIINNELELVHRFQGTHYVYHLKVNENKVQFAGYDNKTALTVLKEWDGQEFKTRARLNIPGVGILPHFSDGKSGWWDIISPTGSNYLIRWLESGELFKETLVTVGEYYRSTKGYIYGVYIDGTGLWKSEKITAYGTTGVLESRIADCEDFVPKLLRVRHRPLAASESVKVYIKKDKAAAYSSALITSDTDGDVKKTYTFPNGTAPIDFAQIKIELTGPGTTSPTDVDCVLLGVPRGMTNAK